MTELKEYVQTYFGVSNQDLATNLISMIIALKESLWNQSDASIDRII